MGASTPQELGAQGLFRKLEPGVAPHPQNREAGWQSGHLGERLPVRSHIHKQVRVSCSHPECPGNVWTVVSTGSQFLISGVQTHVPLANCVTLARLLALFEPSLS